MVFEAVGIDASVTSAIDMVRKGGKVVLVGNVTPRVQLPLQNVVSRELTLLGSAASNGEIPEAIAMIADRRVVVDALVSAVVPLSEGEAWMRRLGAGDRSSSRWSSSPDTRVSATGPAACVRVAVARQTPGLPKRPTQHRGHGGAARSRPEGWIGG